MIRKPAPMYGEQIKGRTLDDRGVFEYHPRAQLVREHRGDDVLALVDHYDPGLQLVALVECEGEVEPCRVPLPPTEEPE